VALDYASIMGAGQQLVPNLRNEALQDQQAQMQQQEMQARAQALQQNAAKQQQALERQQQYQHDLDQTLLSGGDPRAIQQLMLRYPEFADNLKPVLDSMDKDQLQTNLTQMGTIYARAQAGDYKGAAAALQERVDADKAAGQPDPSDDAVLQGFLSGDPVQQKAAAGTIGIHLAAMTGDKFADTYGKLNPSETGGPVQKEYDWRVSQFGKAAADTWLGTQDTKLIPVQAGGQVYAYGGSPTAGSAPAQPEGGDPSASVMGYQTVTNPDRSTWDKRADGTAKGMGFLGLLQRPDGGVSSEISVDAPASELGAKGKGNVEFPLMVPGLTKPELDYLMTHDPASPDFQQNMPRSILAKAADHARARIAQGLSPFKQSGENGTPAQGYTLPVHGGTFGGAGQQYGASRPGGRVHDGLDIAAPEGSPIFPVKPGKVVAVGDQGANSGGLFVRVKHPDGTISGYGHMGHQAVTVGEAVGPDTPLGTVGTTGNATGPVVHLVIRDRNGRTIDPRPLMGAPVRVRTKQDYDKLASGARYIAPDGSHRVKS
jgi:murein DD-endopeptidase MepM/ murein hydrolase activator NlpD